MNKAVVHLNKWLNRLYKTLAILLVLFAVLLSGFRIFLPYAHSYKQDVEDFLNDGYQGDIQIGELTAGWHNMGPTLVVNKLVLSNSSAISIVIDEMDIGIDFWGSLKEQSIKATNFTLIGADILIDQTKIFSQEGATNTEKPTKENPETDLNAVSDLLLKQIERFSLRDSRVLLKTPFKEHRFVIEKLAWLNEGLSHKGIGKIQTFEFPDNSAKLIVDLKGESFDELLGQVYIEGNGLNLSPIFDKALGEKGDQIDSSVHFQSWLNIKNGRAIDLQLLFLESHFNWNSFEQQHHLIIPNSHISITRDNLNTHYYIQSSPINIEFNGTNWGDITLQGEFDKESWQLNADAISLTKLWHLFPLVLENFPHLSDYQNLKLQGNIDNVAIRGDKEGFQASFNFSDLGVNYSGGVPGITNLKGEALIDNTQAFINLSAKNSAIDFDTGFSRPIPFDFLATQITANWADEQFKLTAENVSLYSPELSLSADVQFMQPSVGEAELNLFAFLSNVDASKTQYYLPLAIMDEDLVEYLNGAIYSGKVNQAAVIVNGPLNSFPYTDKSGVFVVDADLQNARYRFEESWPIIEGLEANLNFTANGMLISAYGGDLSGIKMTDVAVAIDDFDASVLTVDTPVSGNFKSVRDLMLNSPLAKNVGETLEFINPRGNVRGDFSLILPLDDTDLAIAKGQFDITNSEIELTAPEMTFSQVNGSLSFNNEKVSVDDMSVFWRGMPLQLSVLADDKEDHYQVDIGIVGEWENKHYLSEIPSPLIKYVDGEVNWRGDLSLFIPENGALTYSVDIASKLNDPVFMLPAPFQKIKGQSWPLKAHAEGGSEHSNITVEIGDEISFFGDLLHENPTFSRAHLMLGNEQMLLPMNGFHITTALDEIDFAQWYPFIDDILVSINSSDANTNNALDSHVTNNHASDVGLLAVPERIRGTVSHIAFYGQTLSDVSFNLLQKPDSWLLQLTSEQVRSRFRFYDNFDEKGMDIDADFVHFTQAFDFSDNDIENRLSKDISPENAPRKKNNVEKTVESQTKSDQAFVLQPNNLPKLTFNCDSCQYQQLNLGKVQFSMFSDGIDKLMLKDFTAERKNINLSLSGQWIKNDTIDQTNVVGKLDSKDIEQEIEAFGFESTIKDSGVKGDIKLNWQGGPDNFNYESLNGKIKVKFDDGYLADVSDKGARILSLFSLQSLVRKLSLDFRDVFSKGMFYNNIEANFNFDDGVVYTDDMKMDATAGNLSVKGNTNLVTRQLDYKMSFSPKVTSSLPVIIGWLVNPIMGVAILAADEAIQKAEVIAFINFELTGTLEDPQFKEVDRKSRDITVGKSKPDSKKPEPPKNPIPSKPLANNMNLRDRIERLQEVKMAAKKDYG